MNKHKFLLAICFLFLIIYPPFISKARIPLTKPMSYEEIIDNMLHTVDNSLDSIEVQQKKIINNTNLIENHVKK